MMRGKVDQAREQHKQCKLSVYLEKFYEFDKFHVASCSAIMCNFDII